MGVRDKLPERASGLTLVAPPCARDIRPWVGGVKGVGVWGGELY